MTGARAARRATGARGGGCLVPRHRARRAAPRPAGPGRPPAPPPVRRPARCPAAAGRRRCRAAGPRRRGARRRSRPTGCSPSSRVDTDGSVVVTETITWRFPEGEERHGILRNVKVRAGYQDSDTQYRYYELTGVSVTSPSGAPTDISISDFGAFRQIRIGSPSQTVSGTADYVVRYRLAHVVNDIGDGTAEFYYNVVDPSNELPAAAGRRPPSPARSRPPGPPASTATSAPRPRARRRPARPAPSPSPTSRPSRAPASSPPTPATPSAT